jgi:hypothetical protein
VKMVGPAFIRTRDGSLPKRDRKGGEGIRRKSMNGKEIILETYKGF